MSQEGELCSLSLGCPPSREDEVENSKHRGKRSLTELRKLVKTVTKKLLELTYSLYFFQMPLMDLSPFLLLIEAGSTLIVVLFKTPALSKDSATYFAWCLKSVG